MDRIHIADNIHVLCACILDTFLRTRDILFSRGYLDWKPHRDVAGRELVGSEAKREIRRHFFLSSSFLPW